MRKIRLHIDEIVRDFERMVRHHERLDVHFDFEKATDAEIDAFYRDMLELVEKYIPTYEKHLSEEYYAEDATTFSRALQLYEMLYENFREIFRQLI
jgi:hypothetical protein